MINQAPFTLCKIYRSERIYWYALFRNPETKERTNKKSVEALRKHLGLDCSLPVKRRDEAIIICQKALDAGLIFETRKTQQTLYSYLEQFYDWEKSEYVNKRIVLDPGSLSPDYFATRMNLLKNHVLPLVHTNLLLSKVTLEFLEHLQFEMVQKGSISHSTINICLAAVRSALMEAKKRGFIEMNVSLELKPLKSLPKTRGIFSEEELSKFMQYAKDNTEEKLYYAFLLALLTGMRSGELRALRDGAIEDGMITIDSAYADKAGVKLPKGKRLRHVPCPQFLCNALKRISSENPNPRGKHLVFWSNRTGSYVSSHYFSERLHQELERSKILSKEEILKRNITFHSFRHMANTLLRGSVDEHILRMTIGHSSENLTNLYTHLSQRGLKSIELAQQKNILPLIGEAEMIEQE